MSEETKACVEKVIEIGLQITNDDRLGVLRAMSLLDILEIAAAKMAQRAREEGKRSMFEFSENFGNIRIVMQGFTADICDGCKEEGNSDG